MTRQAGREAIRRQSRVSRAGAVVRQAGDHGQVELPQASEPLVRPRPVQLRLRMAGDPLPQDRIAQGLEPQTLDQEKIVKPVLVSRNNRLVEVFVAYFV